MCGRRRAFIESFISKYVVSDQTSVAHNSPNSQHNNNNHSNRIMCTEANVLLYKYNLSSSLLIKAAAASSSSSSHNNSNHNHPYLNLHCKQITSMITDYVVKSSFPETFIRCPLAEQSFEHITSHLRKTFPTWSSFHRFMNDETPGRSSDPAPYLGSKTVEAVVGHFRRLGDSSSIFVKLSHITQGQFGG